jgi:hypothetical protein
MTIARRIGPDATLQFATTKKSGSAMQRPPAKPVRKPIELVNNQQIPKILEDYGRA